MKRRSLIHVLIATVAIVAAVGVIANRSDSASETTVSALAKSSDFHGIAVDPNDPSRVYLATHHGLFVVAPDGKAERVSNTRDDLMGFTPHPDDPAILYASGHPATGGNLGFIVSTDGGRSWKKLADGVGGPVDFHQMDVSKANPNIIFGTFRGLQVSKDGGRTWSKVGPAPEGTIDIAASATNADTLYAATKRGIVGSVDGGRSWTAAHPVQRPATMIDAASDGRLYAFQIDTGLIRTTEPGLNWQLVSNDIGGQYILHLAVDPSNGRNMYAVSFDPQARELSIIVSADGGATWKPLGGK